MQAPWYATREDIKSALSYSDSARSDAQVDRALEAASRSVESLLNRHFYPLIATKSFDWPNNQGGLPWRLWLDRDEIISLTSLSSGGVTIPTGNVLLEPNVSGPPYSRIELNRSTTAAFSGGATPQRSVVVAGVFGFCNDTTSAGVLAASTTSSPTTVDITNGAAVGVGDLIQIDSERLIVTGRSFIDSTQTNINVMTANVADAVMLVNGGTFNVGEVIRVGSEQMMVLDVLTATSILVKRAVRGTLIAPLSIGTAIYASRRVAVVRGAVGTVAASHSNAAPIVRNVPPGQARNLTIAEAINQVEQEASQFARTIGSGDNVRNAGGGGLADLRDQVYGDLGRKVRMRVVMGA